MKMIRSAHHEHMTILNVPVPKKKLRDTYIAARIESPRNRYKYDTLIFDKSLKTNRERTAFLFFF